MTCSRLIALRLTAQNVSAKLRKLAFAAAIALSLSTAVAASVIVEAPPASASTRFVDHGGRVLSAAHVYLIYWGRYWAPDRVASPTPDQITHALRTVLAGSYLSALTQYRNIGPPSSADHTSSPRPTHRADSPTETSRRSSTRYSTLKFSRLRTTRPYMSSRSRPASTPGRATTSSASTTTTGATGTGFTTPGPPTPRSWKGPPKPPPTKSSRPSPIPKAPQSSAPPEPATGNDGARSPISAATPPSSTASWLRPTGRTSPVAA